MHMQRFVFCLLLLLVCLPAAQADFTEDFESHPLGTPLSSMGFEPFGGYENLIVQNVGVGGSQGFESLPAPGDIGFPRCYRLETGSGQAGDRMSLSVAVKMRNGQLVGNVPETTVDFQINNQIFNQFLIGAIQRVGSNFESYRLLLFSSEGNLLSVSPEKSVAELGISQNVPGRRLIG